MPVAPSAGVRNARHCAHTRGRHSRKTPVRAEHIYLDRVVDDQVGRNERIDSTSVAAHLFDGVSHGSKIHHSGHTREILQNNSRRHERQLFRITWSRLRAGMPARQRQHIGLTDQSRL